VRGGARRQCVRRVRALEGAFIVGTVSSASLKRLLSVLVVLVLVVALTPVGAFAIREGETSITPRDANGNGKPESWDVDWDGDGTTDEVWTDSNEDGVVDDVDVVNTGGDSTRSPRGKVGMRVSNWPLSGGGELTGIDWDGDGRYDECWWDFDGDGDVDDTDIYETESKILDNTKATRFRGVFVGVKNGLDYPEKDVDDLTGALDDYPASWNPADMNKLKGDAATPAAIQAAINAAKADSKPGDEFIFYFSGHGGGYDKDDGLSGGRIDTNGDETAIQIPESEFGRFDGSRLTTPPAGKVRYHPYDLDGDGTEDTRVVKDSAGNVHVWRPNPNPPPPWYVAGSDADGDGDVDGDDGGVDMNADGDTDDKVGIDDTLLVAGKAKVTDDQLTQWLSGFPESVTIVVILDSCYSGSFIPDLKNGLKDSTGKPLRPGHLEVVTAAPADDEAYEMPVSNGVLTQGILNALIKLPGLITGGHATSLADYASPDTDDRTTTRELFRWAGANAATYMNYDNDGDGLRNEDGPVHAFETTVEFEGEITTPAGTTVLGDLEHLDIDADGDGEKFEDPPTPPDSFFDVYYDPDFGGWPTPTFMQVFTGDNTLSATGMRPEFGMWSEEELVEWDETVPAPTYELAIREVPVTHEPQLLPGIAYSSPVFDVALNTVEQSHDLEEATDTVAPFDMRVSVEDLAAAFDRPVFAEIAPGTGVPPGVPHVYDEFAEEWVPLPVVEIDPQTGGATFLVEHLSMFAMIGPLPGRAADITAPDDPWQLDAVARDDDALLTWRNPTDPDHAATRVLRSREGYADSADDADGQTKAYEGLAPFATDANLSDGLYYYTAFARDHADNWSGSSSAWVKVGDSYSVPVEGLTRYQTAVEASKKAFPSPGLLPTDAEGYKSVVVATGLNWPDALGGSALAGAVGGPILLVGSTVPADVTAEIQRLGATRVLLLGGTGAVSQAAENQLGAIAGVVKVERIAGADRYGTAEKVAEKTVGILPSFDGTAIIATGRAFPDALAGSPLAASKGWPIYLSTATELRASTRSRITVDGVTDALVMGGTGAVPAGVESYLDSTLSGDVIRLAGTDRYGTAAAVGAYGVDTAGLHWDMVAIATGQNFPDALAGGVLQGLDGSVILLTRTASLPSATSEALSQNAHRISEVRFLGGTGAVSQSVRIAVMAAVQ